MLLKYQALRDLSTPELLGTTSGVQSQLRRSLRHVLRYGGSILQKPSSGLPRTRQRSGPAFLSGLQLARNALVTINEELLAPRDEHRPPPAGSEAAPDLFRFLVREHARSLLPGLAGRGPTGTAAHEPSHRRAAVRLEPLISAGWNSTTSSRLTAGGRSMRSVAGDQRGPRFGLRRRRPSRFRSR